MVAYHLLTHAHLYGHLCLHLSSAEAGNTQLLQLLFVCLYIHVMYKKQIIKNNLERLMVMYLVNKKIKIKQYNFSQLLYFTVTLYHSRSLCTTIITITFLSRVF